MSSEGGARDSARFTGEDSEPVSRVRVSMFKLWPASNDALFENVP